MKGNAFYAQSGGVTSVINTTACGVIQTARKHKIKVFAGRNGIIGARPMARLIQENIKKNLADEILFGQLAKGGHVDVSEKNDELTFEITDEHRHSHHQPETYDTDA